MTRSDKAIRDAQRQQDALKRSPEVDVKVGGKSPGKALSKK